MKRLLVTSLAAAAALTALSVCAAQANDTVTFRDVLKPHGHARSKSQVFADGEACGTSGPAHTLSTTMPVFQKCMRAKGWVLDHYAADRSVPVHGTEKHYTDTRRDIRAAPPPCMRTSAHARAVAAARRGSSNAWPPAAGNSS